MINSKLSFQQFKKVYKFEKLYYEVNHKKF